MPTHHLRSVGLCALLQDYRTFPLSLSLPLPLSSSSPTPLSSNRRFRWRTHAQVTIIDATPGDRLNGAGAGGTPRVRAGMDWLPANPRTLCCRTFCLADERGVLRASRRRSGCNASAFLGPLQSGLAGKFFSCERCRRFLLVSVVDEIDKAAYEPLHLGVGQLHALLVLLLKSCWDEDQDDIPEKA